MYLTIQSFRDDEGSWPNWLKTAGKIAIGVAAIGICAVATVMTGGAIAVVKHKYQTQSTSSLSKAVVSGVSTGFATGAITGAVGGTIVGSVKVNQAISNWDQGSFLTQRASLEYHYDKHVIHDGFQNGNNIVIYTNDALNFADRNIATLRLNYNYKYNNTSWNSIYSQGIANGGKYTKDGKIITFWYK